MEYNSSARQSGEVNSLIELAVWSRLYSETNMELILLKGHLLIEVLLESTLRGENIECENFSFYRKIQTLQNTKLKERNCFIIQSLKKLNEIRNKLAHDFNFDITNGEFELWALEVRKNLKGKKFSRYNFRTKIVHSFSIISKNILDL
jgi:hypothetical protein